LLVRAYLRSLPEGSRIYRVIMLTSPEKYCRVNAAIAG